MKSVKEQPTKKKTKTSNVVHIKDPNTENEVSYYLEGWVRKRFDDKVIPDLYKKDKDCVIAIDGGEGTGKSTLALQWCKYVDKSFNLDNVVFTPEEFESAINNAKQGQAILFDEAFTGFSSRNAISSVNKKLVSLMMQVRQKNLFIVFVLPTFFLLDKYISMFRTRVLVHVYENKGQRGYFKVYSSKNKKRLLMDKAAKIYSYGVSTKKKGRFYGVFPLEDESAYRKKKLEALKDREKDSKKDMSSKYMQERDFLLCLLKNNLELSYRQMEEWLKEKGFELSYRQIATICKNIEKNSQSESSETADSGEKEDSDEDLEGSVPVNTAD